MWLEMDITGVDLKVWRDGRCQREVLGGVGLVDRVMLTAFDGFLTSSSFI